MTATCSGRTGGSRPWPTCRRLPSTSATSIEREPTPRRARRPAADRGHRSVSPSSLCGAPTPTRPSCMHVSRSPDSSKGRSTTPARWRSSPKRRAGAETVRQHGSDSATRCRPSSGSATAAGSPTVSTVWPDWRPTPARPSAAVGSKARRRSFASHAAGGRYGPPTPRESPADRARRRTRDDGRRSGGVRARGGGVVA